MSAENIKAGRAYVEIDADARKAQGELKDFQASMQQSGRELQKIGATAAGVGIGIVASLTAAAVSAAAYGDALNDLSAKTGIAVASLASLGYSAEQSGTNLGSLEIAIKKMQNAIADAVNGNAQARQSFERLGVSVESLQGLSPDEQFRKIGGAVADIANPAQRAAAAIDVFGKSGTDMLPMLANGSAGLREMESRARSLGIVMGAEAAAGVGELDDIIAEATGQIGALKNVIGATIAEAIIPYRENIAKALAGAIEWAKENKQFIVTVAGLGASLVGIGGTIMGVGLTISTMTKSITALTGAMSALRVAMVAHPILLLAGVVAAAATSYYLLTAAMRENTEVVSDNARKALAAGDAQRQSTNAQLDRLNALAKGQRLSTAEMNEADTIIAGLTKQYGDLGLSIDSTTGELNGMAAAQDKVNEAMNKARAAQLKSSAQEQERNLEVKERQVDDSTERQVGRTIWYGSEARPQNDRERRRNVAEIAAMEDELKATIALYEAVSGEAFAKAPQNESGIRVITRDIQEAQTEIERLRERMKDLEGRGFKIGDIAIDENMAAIQRLEDRITRLRRQLAGEMIADPIKLPTPATKPSNQPPGQSDSVRDGSTEDIEQRSKALADAQQIAREAARERMTEHEKELREIAEVRDARIAAARKIIDDETKAGRGDGRAASAAQGAIADANATALEKTIASADKKKTAELDAARAVAELEMQQEIELAKLRKDNQRARQLEAEQYLREQERRFAELDLTGDQLAQARTRAQEIAAGILDDEEEQQRGTQAARVFASASAAAVAGGFGGSVNVLENEAKRQTKQNSEQIRLLQDIARKIGIPTFN